MVSDYVPIVHTLEGRTIKLWAIADVHIGARECMLGEFCKWVDSVKNDPDSYVVICGDLLNNGTRDSVTNVYEETMPPSAQVDKAVEILQPIANRILGGVGGNHELRSSKAVDLDPLYTVFVKLGIQDRYRRDFAFLRIILERDNIHDHYALMLVHGKSESKRKQFDLCIEGVDAVIGGHVHNGSIAKNARLVLTHRNRVVVKPFVSLTATSWLSYGGYAAQSLYKPTATSDPQYLELEFANSNGRHGQMRVVW